MTRPRDRGRDRELGKEDQDERDDRDRDHRQCRGLLVLPRVLLQQLRHRELLLLDGAAADTTCSRLVASLYVTS